MEKKDNQSYLDIQAGNKLIAEFIGWKLVCLNPGEPEEDHYVEYHRFDYKGEVVETHSGGDSWCWSKGKTIPFHSSWDWLMPVVEKISKIKVDWEDAEYNDTFYPRTFGMTSADGNQLVRLNAHPLFEAPTLIEATWLAVVDFIERYNTQKHPTP